MKPSNRILQIALLHAKTSGGVGHKGFCKMAAVLFKGNKVLKLGINKDKTHPKLDKYTEYPYIHAETDVLLNYRASFKGTSLLVVRTNLKGTSNSMSKPCTVCSGLIKQVGIKKTYWTDWNGELQCE